MSEEHEVDNKEEEPLLPAVGQQFVFQSLTTDGQKKMIRAFRTDSPVYDLIMVDASVVLVEGLSKEEHKRFAHDHDINYTEIEGDIYLDIAPLVRYLTILGHWSTIQGLSQIGMSLKRVTAPKPEYVN